MTTEARPDLLDDVDQMQRLDASAMLEAVASAGAQVREAARISAEADLGALRDDGRPRAVVVTGMGGSGIAGQVLQAVAGPECPVPVERVRAYGLPAWVGPLDLVIAVSYSGTTAETLASFLEARRRGARLMVVSQARSPLADAAAEAHAPFVPVRGGRMPRASMWALSVPLLVAGAALGVLRLPEGSLAEAADLLDEIAVGCRPSSESFVNPAKSLALDLAGSFPMIWGTSDLAGIAAYRFMCQLAENAKYPSVNGVLPEALHNQVVTFDGMFRRSRPVDIFADPDDLDAGMPPLRLVVLRDSEEHPQVASARGAAVELADRRGIAVSEIAAREGSPLTRFASLVALTDYASVYLALALGLDPSPIAAIAEIKTRRQQ